LIATATQSAALVAALPAPFLDALALGFGCTIGSFLNVLIHRLPREESPWRGRSHCPHCQRMVRWYENVPVLSFLALGGRCAGCKRPIAWRYPAVELAAGVIAVICARHYGWSGEAAAYFLFLAALLAIACIDWEHMIIPDELSLGVLLIGLVLSATVLPTGVWQGVGGAAAGAGFVWGIAWLYRKTRGVEGMGFGDVKMAGMIGAFLGPLGVLLAIFMAAFLGSLWGGVRLARGGTRRSMVAFGTFLAAGAALCLFFGDALRAWYLGALRR
jgi:leader peptidase (prepilin peptidase)/N-methyltransferase